MITCPFCSFKNEDGTLFCERCKSDLLSIPEPKAMPAAEQNVIPEEQHAVETVPANEVPMAEPIAAEAASAEASSNGAPAPTWTDECQPAEQQDQAAAAEATTSQARLQVIRGMKINVEYALYAGENFIGRTDEKPVDIDLEEQESPDRIWCSRQHAKVVVDENGMNIEDLGSQNGTFVNRARIYPGQVRPLAPGDVIQIGTVQLKVKTPE
jgi:hypothetical protein